MKLLVVIPSLHRGGAERVVSMLTQEWCKTHEVLLAVFDASQPAYAHGGKLIDLSAPAQAGVVRKTANAFSRILRLSRLIRREHPDRIISFMESANFPATFAALLTGDLGRLSVSVRNDPSRFTYAYRLLLPLLYRLPRRVVAVSQGVALALGDMGVPKNRLTTIPNPSPQRINSSDQANRPNTAPERYILGVGRLHQQKGFDRLLHAFSSIADPDLHLVILGEGGERASLEALAKSLGIGPRVLMPGAIADPMPWYQHAACFVLSSRHEGWPNVLFEAMCNGCPVVSFDCQYGPSEIIHHEVNGLLINEGDVARLANAVNSVICDANLRTRLMRAGLYRTKEYDISLLSECWFDSSNGYEAI